MPARIHRVTLYAASLPLAEPFEHASSGYIDRLEEILLRLGGLRWCGWLGRDASQQPLRHW